MPKSANRFSPRLFALAFFCSVLGCSRANPPAPLATTSAPSDRATTTQAPSQQTGEGSVAPAPATPPTAAPPTATPPTATPPAATPPAARSAAQPPRAPEPARASFGAKPQDCSVYDTSPDYRALSAQDRAHGRLTCETKEEFRAFVASRRACKAASDCAIVSGSCPFDCYIPIAKAGEREVRAKLASLDARLDKAGNRCTYGCMGSPEAECVDGRCQAGNR